MAVVAVRDHYRIPVHPLHAVLLAGTLPLFLGAVLSDWAYASSYQIQWTNFASWLIAGGLVVGAMALVCAILYLLRGSSGLVPFLLLLATWVLGFINALVHARDAWATMPTGLVLSIVVFLLACAATWAGLARGRAGGAP